MSHIEDFTEWIQKERKKNGEKILDSTNETYIAIANKFLNAYGVDKNIIEHMNNQLHIKQTPMHFATYKHILDWLDYPDTVKVQLKKPKFSATALKSKRILQSKVLSIAEIKTMLDYVRSNTKSLLLIKLLYDTAARKGGIIKTHFIAETYHGLRPMDINFNKNEITLIEKGRKTRTVIASQSTIDLTKKYIEDNAIGDKDTIISFVKRNGKPFKNQEYECWKEVREIGLQSIGKAIHPHMFRHSRVTHWADEGADVLDLKEMAGHDDISSTMIYIQISSYRRKEAFRKFGFDIEAKVV